MNVEVAIQLFAIFAILIVIGTPIYAALGVSALAVILFNGLVPLEAIPNQIQAALASFTLLAVPFFILAGNILASSQLTQRLVNFALAVVGPIRGGLGVVAGFAGFLFGGVSGSGPASTAALGSTLLPRMKAAGYDPGFSAALLAACGSIGVIVPPSIVIIIYGAVAQVSIGQLFAAAIVPGLLAALMVGLTTMWKMRKHTPDIVTIDEQPEVASSHVRGSVSTKVGTTNTTTTITAGTVKAPRHLWYHARRAGWALLAPVIVLGGIYSGVFTPTEAAAVVVLYALIVGFIIYRDLSVKEFTKILGDSGRASGTIMLIIACASLFAFVLNTQGIAGAAANTINEVAPNALTTLLAINLIGLVIGCFLDGISALYILVPILLPAALAVDVDPVHLGVVLTINLAMGMLTPPVGVNIYVAAAVGKTKVASVIRKLGPVFLGQVIVLLIVTYIPAISLWLPTVFGMR